MKKLSLLLAAFFLILLLPSCGSKADTLSVSLLSPYDPSLLTLEAQPGEVLTKQKVEEFNDLKTKTFTEYHSYGDYLITLNYDGNKQVSTLCLRASEGYDDHCFYNGGSGFLTGYSYGEFGSGLIYRSFTSAGFDGVPVEDFDAVNAVDVELVFDDDCVALLAPGRFWWDDECYAVTAWNGWDGNHVSSVWCLTFPTADHGHGEDETVDTPADPLSETAEADEAETVTETIIRKEKIMDLPDGADAYAAAMDTDAEEPLIYILAGDGLYAVGLDGDCTAIKMPAHWAWLHIHSMVYWEGSLYMGTEFGILRYVIAEDDYLWYEFDFHLQGA